MHLRQACGLKTSMEVAHLLKKREKRANKDPWLKKPLRCLRKFCGQKTSMEAAHFVSKKQKQKQKNTSAFLCFLCFLFCRLLMVSGNTWEHSSFFPFFYFTIHPIIHSIHFQTFLHHLHTPHSSIPEHNVARKEKKRLLQTSGNSYSAKICS